MTNSQPEESNIDEQLNQILDDLDIVRNTQRGHLAETRTVSQSLRRLERATVNLARVATQNQQEMRANNEMVLQLQQNIDKTQNEIKQNQENIARMLEFFENPNRGDSPPN